MSTELLQERWFVALVRNESSQQDSQPSIEVWTLSGEKVVEVSTAGIADHLVANHNALVDAVDRLPQPAFFYAGETREEVGTEEAWRRDQVVAFGAAILRHAVTPQAAETTQPDEFCQPPLSREADATFVYKLKAKSGYSSETKGALSVAQHAAVSRIFGTQDLPVIWSSGRITASEPA